MKDIQRKNLSIDFRGNKYEIRNLYTHLVLVDKEEPIEVRLKIHTLKGIKTYLLTKEEISTWLPLFNEMKRNEEELNEEYSRVIHERISFIYRLTDTLKAYEVYNKLSQDNLRLIGNIAELAYEPIKDDRNWELLEDIAYDYQDETHKISIKDINDDEEQSTIIEIEFNDGYNIIN